MEFLQQNITVLLIACFLLITFLFSVIEKLIDWKNTIAFYKNHFNETFVRSKITFWVAFVVFIEVMSLIILIVGIYNILFFSNLTTLFYAFICIEVVFLVLLIGQRIAKDYAGAANITIYFLLTILGFYFINS